jgi:hypothetical protein
VLHLTVQVGDARQVQLTAQTPLGAQLLTPFWNETHA